MLLLQSFVSGTGFDLLEGERCLGGEALKDLLRSRKFSGAGLICSINYRMMW